jgi:hypothetical protein
MFDPTTLVGFHTWLSLIGIVTGIVVVLGLTKNQGMPGWTAAHLVTSVGTSATGFLFAVNAFLPSHAVGVLSLIALALAIVGRYMRHYAGAWRWIYAVSITISTYFLVFVGVVQAFGKIPSLNALAPTQSEPPFAIAQLVVLAIFVVLSTLGVRRFHPA